MLQYASIVLSSHPADKKNERTFFPSEQLLMAHLSLARQTPISSLSNYVRTYGVRSLLPGSVCGLITRCMRARELLPSLLRPISERRGREGWMAESLSVSLSSLRLPFRHPSDRVPNAKFHPSLLTRPKRILGAKDDP